MSSPSEEKTDITSSEVSAEDFSNEASTELNSIAGLTSISNDKLRWGFGDRDHYVWATNMCGHRVLVIVQQDSNRTIALSRNIKVHTPGVSSEGIGSLVVEQGATYQVVPYGDGIWWAELAAKPGGFDFEKRFRGGRHAQPNFKKFLVKSNGEIENVKLAFCRWDHSKHTWVVCEIMGYEPKHEAVINSVGFPRHAE